MIVSRARAGATGFAAAGLVAALAFALVLPLPRSAAAQDLTTAQDILAPGLQVAPLAPAASEMPLGAGVPALLPQPLLAPSNSPSASLPTGEQLQGKGGFSPVNDPEGMGVLTREEGGFGRRMWEGTDRRVIEVLLPRLPAGVSSPTLFTLERRLLLSDAEVPPPRGGTSRNSDLLTVRLERLAALGDLDGLARLLALAPAERTGGLRERLEIETALVEGDPEGACTLARQNSDRAASDDSFWLKTLVLCQLLGGERAAAELSLAILRDSPRADDQLFLRLAEAALGHAPLTTTELNRLDSAGIRPLEFVLLTSMDVTLPPPLLRSASPRARLQLVYSQTANLNDRLAAAEWAVNSRRLPVETLEGLYASFPFSDDEVDDALQTGYALEGVEARALYFQSAVNQKVPQLAAAATELALERAQADGVYEATAQVMMGQLSIEPTDTAFSWFADTAGRALYALGRYEEATAWLLLARQEAAISAQAAVAAHRLWPYSRLAGIGAVNTEAGLAGWRYTQSDPNGLAVAKRLSLLRVMFQALGESDALSWIDLAISEDERNRALPDASLLYALDDASMSGRLGETVLLSLIVMGDKPPAEVHPLALNAVLTALMRVGLPMEARALAIEAALGSGI